MSYSAIADAINAKFRTAYSRNATVGRARRMGLASPGQFEDQGKPLPTVEAPGLHAINPRMRERHVFEFWRLPPVFEATEVFQLRTADVVPHHLSLIDLEHGDCRYPYGGDTEGEVITFCGHPRRPGSSYCAAHFDLSVGPGTASERSAARDLRKAVEAERNVDRTDLRTFNIQGAIQYAAR